MKTRSHKYLLRLSHTRSLQIGVRRFRIAKAQRSRRQRQLIINTNLLGVRQVVLSFKVQRPVGRPKKSRLQLSPQRLRVASAVTLIVIGLVGSIFWGSQLFTNKSLEPAKAFAAPTAKVAPKAIAKTLPAAQPVHISIPSVNIDADITPIGLDANGALALPLPTAWEVGWYTGSPTPGQLGPAVIAGHVDSTTNISVFWRLRYVAAGDQVLITRSDGSTATFTISALDQYDQSNFPTSTVYGNLDYAGLKLITCGGEFDEQTHHYTQNTVVSAKLQ